MKNKRFSQPKKEVAISKRARGCIGVAIALALVALMFFPFGCSKLLPTAPGTGEDQVEGYRAEDIWPGPFGKETDNGKSKAKSKARGSGRFDDSGGVLYVVGDFDIEFEVPPNALIEEVFISAEAELYDYWEHGTLLKRLDLEFQPNGLVFLEPAGVVFEAALLEVEDGEILKLYWLNTETGLWDVEQELVVVDATLEVEFDISHFSRYAISR